MVPPDGGLVHHRAPLPRDSLDAKELRYSQVLQHPHDDLRRQMSKDVERRFRVLLQETNLVGDVSGQTSYSKVSKDGLLGAPLDAPSRMRPMLSKVRIRERFEDDSLTVACGPGA